jgi:16S rRNA (cytosine1402-N4)-methyltransferase
MIVHRPVLLQEVLDYLQPGHEPAVLVDATLGEGGHTAAFLERFPGLFVVGIERDAHILQIAQERIAVYKGRFKLIQSEFSEVFAHYADYELAAPDRIIMDLGISTFHYEKGARGFTFSQDEPLDMRLDSSTPVSAADIVNTYPEAELADVFFNFGEENFSRRIARRIVQERSKAPFTSSLQLAQCITKAVPPAHQHKRLHPATKVFQALRIAVNNELENLSLGLEKAFQVLKTGGRLGVIAFHSLEDRIVKQFFQNLNKACICPEELPICQCTGTRLANRITKKPVMATEEEVRSNPPSRSARLRVIEKIRAER